jgi:hypothetical protein
MKNLIALAMIMSAFAQTAMAASTQCLYGKIQRNPSVLFDQRTGNIIGLIFGEKNTSNLSDGAEGYFKFRYTMSEDGPIVSSLEKVESCGN